MDTQTLFAAAVALVVGIVIGRATAGGKKETVVWTEPPRRRDRADGAAQGAAEDDAQILALVRAGQKIHAIKRYRELYGSGLKEAKDAIDRLG